MHNLAAFRLNELCRSKLNNIYSFADLLISSTRRDDHGRTGERDDSGTRACSERRPRRHLNRQHGRLLPDGAEASSGDEVGQADGRCV